MPNNKIVISDRTADGHKYDVIKRTKYKLSLCCRYYLRVHHFTINKAIIMEMPIKTQSLAIQLGDQWTLADHIISLQEILIKMN